MGTSWSPRFHEVRGVDFERVGSERSKLLLLQMRIEMRQVNLLLFKKVSYLFCPVGTRGGIPRFGCSYTLKIFSRHC